MANGSLSEESLAARQPHHASMLTNEHDSRPT